MRWDGIEVKCQSKIHEVGFTLALDSGPILPESTVPIPVWPGKISIGFLEENRGRHTAASDRMNSLFKSLGDRE